MASQYFALLLLLYLSNSALATVIHNEAPKFVHGQLQSSRDQDEELIGDLKAFKQLQLLFTKLKAVEKAAPVPDGADCGEPAIPPKTRLFVGDNRIVGGEEAIPNSWPWQVLLYPGDTLCGGSLINTQWVLTAAHCAEGLTANDFVVYAGAHKQDGSGSSVQPRKVKVLIVHPSYNNANKDNDIALLKLDSPVTFNDKVSPVCLVQKGQTAQPGRVCVATGWGKTTDGGSASDVLRQIKLPIVSAIECNNEWNGRITDNMLCAGGVVGKDTCQGDSGGPLVCQDSTSGRWFLNGVTSFGNQCATSTPGVYASVEKYLYWIAEQIRSN